MPTFPISQHIFGIHDKEGARFLTDAGKPGWVVVSVRVSDAPEDFSELANAGHGVIVRLNHGYEPDGTIPHSSQYDAFAAACADYAARSQGAHIWLIGNETNAAWERPGKGTPQEEPLTPKRYAACFAKCRAAIHQVAGHAQDWVMPAPPGPWNTQTLYDGNPAGDWVHYFRDILNECLRLDAPPDALALHTYSTHAARMDAALIENEERAPSPFANWHWQFRTYRDFLAVVPNALRRRPALITEAQHLPWENNNVGWIQKAYAEINAWNADPAQQPIQALCLFRWQKSDDAVQAGWGMSDKPQLLGDFRAAMQNEYRVRLDETAPPLVVTKPRPTANANVLPLAQARWFVEETLRQLENNQGAAARKIMTETVIDWFYDTARENSTDLQNAQAHTAARWWCEEATREIEKGDLANAHDHLRDNVLRWLYSAGPSALGILSVEYPSKPKAKPKARAKKSQQKAPPKKTSAKKTRAQKPAAKKARRSKPKVMLLNAE